MMKKQEAMGNALRAGRHALSKEVPVGYKQTGLSVLPSGWSTCTLGEIGQCLIGLTYEPKNVGSDGLLVLRSSNIGDGTLQFDDHVFVNMEVPERIIVCEDDLLICVRNGSRPLIGKCALIDHRAIGMTFGAFMSVFRSPDNRFVFYCFQSDIVKHQIHEHLGATINQITNRSLSSFQIPYPGAEERDAIADALSDVDGLLRALETLIAKKRAIKQAAMQQLPHRQDPPAGVQRDSGRRSSSGDLLYYVRPDRYIVQCIDYSVYGDLRRIDGKQVDYIGLHRRVMFMPICTDIPVLELDDVTTDCKYPTDRFKSQVVSDQASSRHLQRWSTSQVRF